MRGPTHRPSHHIPVRIKHGAARLAANRLVRQRGWHARDLLQRRVPATHASERARARAPTRMTTKATHTRCQHGKKKAAMSARLRNKRRNACTLTRTGSPAAQRCAWRPASWWATGPTSVAHHLAPPTHENPSPPSPWCRLASGGRSRNSHRGMPSPAMPWTCATKFTFMFQPTRRLHLAEFAPINLRPCFPRPIRGRRCWARCLARRTVSPHCALSLSTHLTAHGEPAHRSAARAAGTAGAGKRSRR